MKKLLTVLFCVKAAIASAQWSDITNKFDDSLHMPVCTATGVQSHPIVLTSYPDGGYFVIWQDDRNTATTQTDIYAQKFDRDGRRLWAENGIPVTAAPKNQHYYVSSNQDYRNRSYAATDSAGGFYITYVDDSTTNYYWGRITVQHVRSDGTRVFPEPGRIIAQSGGSTLYDYTMPQLIADGNKGFFIGYRQTYYELVHVACFRDEGGKLVYYGGSKMNENAYQVSYVAACGTRTEIVRPGQVTYDFHLWSDAEGGCNVVINMNANNGTPSAANGYLLAYNRLWRAKKDSKVKTYFRNTSGAVCPRITEYKKGDVYPLYYMVSDFQSVFCAAVDGSIAYAYTNYRLLSNGYLTIDRGDAYDYSYPKGVTAFTDSNINVNLIAVTRRSYVNNTVSDFTVQGYAYPVEKFDSVPYQRASYMNPDFGYNVAVPQGLKKLNNFRDTLLGFSNYYTDFAVAASRNEIYAAGLMGSAGTRQVRLQYLEVNRKSADSFAVEYSTNIAHTPQKAGITTGAELSTGFTGSSISYDHPLFATNANTGRFVFYTRDFYGSGMVSPIISRTQLEWGAMGKSIGTTLHNTGSTFSYYNFDQPVITLDANGTSGIIAWKDDRYDPANPTAYNNIYMRHLDRLDASNYQPPIRKPRQLYNSSVPVFSHPVAMFGASDEFTTVEAVTYDYNTSALVDIHDNYWLGSVDLRTYQHIGPVRKVNNEAFLNRNYTIKPDSLQSNAVYDMILYFPAAEFNALKSAEFVVEDPGYLSVIRQPSSTAVPPVAYAPVAGEEVISPIQWFETEDGYGIRILSKGMGNFFIKKLATTSICSATAASFTSNITGATYQWQVNTGGLTFTDISDNANYSGSKTSKLTINNIPSSFNGYRYRCLVALNFSNTFALQVANTWTGSVNNLWENAGNWSCNKVPDANTDVIINNGTPTVNSNTATCRSIRINTPGSLNVTPGFKLTVAH
ncbi:MAG: hypothetical protein QM791_22655 [Ferruginibacter sp.]